MLNEKPLPKDYYRVKDEIELLPLTVEEYWAVY
jgi:hypothetical protein